MQANPQEQHEEQMNLQLLSLLLQQDFDTMKEAWKFVEKFAYESFPKPTKSWSYQNCPFLTQQQLKCLYFLSKLCNQIQVWNKAGPCQICTKKLLYIVRSLKQPFRLMSVSDKIVNLNVNVLLEEILHGHPQAENCILLLLQEMETFVIIQLQSMTSEPPSKKFQFTKEIVSKSSAWC